MRTKWFKHIAFQVSFPSSKYLVAWWPTEVQSLLIRAVVPCLAAFLSPNMRFLAGIISLCVACLLATHRAILRYYRFDTPDRATPYQGGQHSPKMV